jgi:hypothetical protein
MWMCSRRNVEVSKCVAMACRLMTTGLAIGPCLGVYTHCDPIDDWTW